jgi:hypothetical protein
MALRRLSMELPTGATGEGGYNGVRFDDERDRPVASEVDKRAVASVTLDSDHPEEAQTWGEFLTLKDVAAPHAWTGALLADHYRESGA